MYDYLNPDFEQDCRDSHDEYKSLPASYYDSDCRDWQEDFYHQPKNVKVSFGGGGRSNLFHWLNNFDRPQVRLLCGEDDTPASERNSLYYAHAYAAFFDMASRQAEKDFCFPKNVYDRENDAISDLAYLYRRKYLRAIRNEILRLQADALQATPVSKIYIEMEILHWQREFEYVNAGHLIL